MTEPRFKLLKTETELLPITKDAAGSDVRPVRVIVSTAGVDRMGDIIVQEGIDLAAYRTNPVVLWQHDSDRPIARAPDVRVVGGKLTATALFPVDGADEEADYVYGKIKAGIVNAASIGFNPIEWEAIDPKQPWGGQKFVKTEMLEFSFCSIPANKDCVIIGRSVYSLVAPEAREAAAIVDMIPISRKILDAVKALPAQLRADGKKAPKGGARGIYLRNANLLERTLGGIEAAADDVVDATQEAAEAAEAAAAEAAETVAVAGAAAAATSATEQPAFRAQAERRLGILKRRIQIPTL